MRLKVMVSILLALGVCYGFFWHYMAGEVEEKIEIWVTEQKANGLSVSYDDLDISGFPYRMELAIKSLNIVKTGRNRTPVIMQSDQATLVAFPWKLNHGVIVSDGAKVRIGSRRSPKLTLNIGKTRASIMVDYLNQKFETASFVMDQVTWVEGRPSKRKKASQAHDVKLHILRPAASSNDNDMDLPVQAKVYLEAKDVNAQEIPVGILGKKADRVTIDLQLHGDSLPRYTKESLVAWRDQGGTLAVNNAAIVSGEMDINLNGEVTLDQDLKPLGTFAANIHGVDHIVGILSQHSGFQVEPGRMILDELQKMSKVDPQGNPESKPELDLAISLQGGLLFLGPIPVYEIPPVIED